MRKNLVPTFIALLFTLSSSAVFASHGGTASGGNAKLAVPAFQYSCRSGVNPKMLGNMLELPSPMTFNDKNWTQSQGTDEYQVNFGIAANGQNSEIHLQLILFSKDGEAEVKGRSIGVFPLGEEKIKIYAVREERGPSPGYILNRRTVVVECYNVAERPSMTSDPLNRP